MISLQHQRNAALTHFMRDMQAMDFRPARATFQKDRISLVYPDETRALLYVNSVKGGFGPGEFGMYIGLTLSNGPVFHVLKKARLAGGSSFPRDLIFRITSHSLKGGRGLYAFRTAAVESGVKRMVRDARNIYLPLIDDFTIHYKRAAQFIVDHKGHHARKPFAMVVVLLCLSDALGQLPRWMGRIQTGYFWDLRKTTDYRTQILKPISRCVNLIHSPKSSPFFRLPRFDS